jgi:hypothetical protein
LRVATSSVRPCAAFGLDLRAAGFADFFFIDRS